MDIIHQIKNIQSDRKELRRFGFSITIVLLLIGSIALWRGKSFFYVFYIGAGMSLASVLLMPRILLPIQKTLASLLIIVRSLLTVLALSITFYLIFAPIGLIARLCGKYFMDERIDTTRTSYWITKPQHEFKRENYERQF